MISVASPYNPSDTLLMFKKLVQRIGRLPREIRNLKDYHRVEKHVSNGEFVDALELIRVIGINRQQATKSILLEATILHRMKRFSEATSKYEEFIRAIPSSDLPDPDRHYLLGYARYFRSSAYRGSGSTEPLDGNLARLCELERKSGFLTKREFPMPKSRR